MPPAMEKEDERKEAHHEESVSRAGTKSEMEKLRQREEEEDVN